MEERREKNVKGEVAKVIREGLLGEAGQATNPELDET